MHYIPATEDEIKQMLDSIGLLDLDALFAVIPEKFRLKRLLDLPEAMSEWDIANHLNELSEKNKAINYKSFLGGGAYPHITSAVVDTLISRSEFATAYTPYQPEVSQGTLQAIFEFQSYVSELFGMDVSNASMYDAASSFAEAALMAERIQKKKTDRVILVSSAVNPYYRETLATYLQCYDIEIIEIPVEFDADTKNKSTGKTNHAICEQLLNGREAIAIMVQSPNYFGVIEELSYFRKIADISSSILVVAVAEPVSMGILEPPGSFGADIVVAEGQSFGIPLSFGGPYLGMFSTLEKHVRALPGRIVGKTVDVDGQPGYVLTLATREQHIRREKATSNICTNQGLVALSATIFLSLLGREGIVALAKQNFSKAQYLKKEFSKLDGFDIVFTAPTFNEFVVSTSKISVTTLMERLEQRGIIGGIPLLKYYPFLENAFLVAVTEVHKASDMDFLIQVCKEEGR